MEAFVKALLGFPPDADDDKAQAEWKRRTEGVCKPCWELKYCPYGPLVEQFPTPPIPRAEMIEHNQRLKQVLEAGVEDAERRAEIEGMVRPSTLRCTPRS